jgi:hypothetical protein
MTKVGIVFFIIYNFYLPLCDCYFDIVDKIEQILGICLLKVRDQDEKIRCMAFETLRGFPMNILIELLSGNEWSAISKGLTFERKSEACGVRGYDF